MNGSTATEAASHPGRFSYVRYDEQSVKKQEAMKAAFEAIEALAEANLQNGRPKALVMTALEEAYMWVGKAIRDEQVARNSQTEHSPSRG